MPESIGGTGASKWARGFFLRSGPAFGGRRQSNTSLSHPVKMEPIALKWRTHETRPRRPPQPQQLQTRTSAGLAIRGDFHSGVYSRAMYPSLSFLILFWPFMLVPLTLCGLYSSQRQSPTRTAQQRRRHICPFGSPEEWAFPRHGSE